MFSFFASIGNAIWNTIQAIGYGTLKFTWSQALSVATLTVGVKGYMQARQMLAKGQDILANKTAAGGKIPVIYGTRRVGAQVVYMDTADNYSMHLFVVYAISVGEVDEIMLRTLEIDGNPLTDPNQFRDGGYIGSDKISSGAGSLCTGDQVVGTGIGLAGGTFGTDPTGRGYRYVFNAHHGAATQTADPMLTASIGSKWTSAHKLNGIAYIAASFYYDEHGTFRGVPQITVQVKGKKVYDPRDSGQTFGTPSTYEYSDNPSLTFLDYITNNDYGKGLTASQLNLSTFSSAANTADTLVDQPYYSGTAKSFTWSGTSGNNFIVVPPSGSGGLHWWQNKVGEIFTLTDSSSNVVLNAAQITAVERTHYYGQGVRLLIYFNQTLGATYSSQTGTSLAKVKRFHCNGYVDTNKNVMDNAKELLANMRGIFLYINGQYELSIEDTGSSTFSITDNHIIADAGISVDYGNKDKKANKVIIEFFNANKKYELDTATVLHDASPEYYSDDNDEILEIKAEFPYISDPYIAYNMGKAILTRSRNQTTMQFLGTPEMYKLNVGDIVDLTYTGLGFSGKVCRVEALELQSNGLVAVSLIEYFDVYTWEVPPQEEFEEISNTPSAYAVAAPTGLAFTDTDSSAINRPFISWTLPTDYPYNQWRVNVVDSSSNQVLNKIVNVNNVDLNFIPKGTDYVASITALNTLGVESSPTALTFTVADEPTVAADIADGAITTNKLADDAVTTAKIIDDAVTNALIATDAVNQDSIAANSVTASEIVANTITASEIAASTITSAQIAANTIVADDIATGTLTSASGVFGTISADDVTTGTLNANNVAVTNLNADNITTGTLSADNIQIDDVTIDSDGSGNLIIKSGGVDTTQIADSAITDAKVNDLSATKLTAGTIDADVITVTNFTADNINGDIDKLEPVSLTPNQSIGTSYTTLAIITLPAPDLTTAGNGHTPFFSLVLSATLSGGGAQMDIQCQLLGTPIGGTSTFYTAAESGQDHNFSSGSISQSVSGSFNQKVGSACYLYVKAKRNAGTITVNKIQGIYAGLRGG